MAAWAARHYIDSATLSVLTDEGFTSLSLLRHLSAADVTNFFQKPGLLPASQCLLLQRALRQLCDEGGFDDVTEEESASTSKQKYVWAGNGDGYRFLMLGRTGSGKSTTGNTILGEPLFRTGNSFGSVTSESEMNRRTNLGKDMQIVDTPGLFDTRETHERVSVDIISAVAGMHPGPDAILYVIAVDRYTDQEHAVYARLKALFDDHLSSYLVVVFTGGDRLRRQAKPYSCPKYHAIGQGLEAEVERRLAAVEKLEAQRTQYVQRQERERAAARRAQREGRDAFARREQADQVQMQRERERMDRKVQEMQRVTSQAKKELDEERRLRRKLETEREEETQAMKGFIVKTSHEVTVTESTDFQAVIRVAGRRLLVKTPAERIESLKLKQQDRAIFQSSSSNGRVSFESAASGDLVVRTSTKGVVVEVIAEGGRVNVNGLGPGGVVVVTLKPELTVVVSGEILGVE